MSTYKLPSWDLLDYTEDMDAVQEEENRKAEELEKRIFDLTDRFKIKTYDRTHRIYSQFYRFNFAIDGKYSKIKSLKDDISLACGVPVSLGLEGHYIKIDVPKADRAVIKLGDFKGSFEGKSNLAFALGNDTVCDLAEMPHLLIAGTTGSGKSVCVNTMLVSLLMRNTPDDLGLILIDPKSVELTPYEDIPHLIMPVATDNDSAVNALEWAVNEMERRYTLLSARGVKDIDAYNKYASDKLSRIVVVVDELADIMITSRKSVEPYIVRIAQKARAAGIHLVLATQRPTVDVITGLIKANVPSRIAFKTASGVDSRVILDRSGAENLLGKGDMLYHPSNMIEPIRLQGVYTSDDDIEAVCTHVCLQDVVKPQIVEPEHEEEPKKNHTALLAVIIALGLGAFWFLSESDNAITYVWTFIKICFFGVMIIKSIKSFVSGNASMGFAYLISTPVLYLIIFFPLNFVVDILDVLF